ncbi:GNAT family N-acetyltransferase [Sulfobacillus thermosulfidooxidans]|uniref:GNAT family N-acetyltransferase n=1 Tax=Sulfobacillus thermosulfidooxidans TaxID=28034 RepID=UPI0006B5D115|nr:GNAT family N-acetyltransferase [Sulfobacillus thermosulfidooxidans]
MRKLQGPREISFPDFTCRVRDYLLESEAAHNLLWGLIGQLSRDPLIAEKAYWVSIENESGAVCGVALRTEGHQLVLSDFRDEQAVAELARELYHDHIDLPGVLGPAAVAKIFSETWTKLMACQSQLLIREQIYELTAASLHAQSLADGEEMVQLTDQDDVEWLVSWIHEFEREAMPEFVSSLEQARTLVQNRLRNSIRDGGFFILKDAGMPRSVVGYAHPTPHGIRIAPVYTPPCWRNYGYASRLVALSCQKLLEFGYTHIYLFADKANPAANRVYQQTGFQMVREVNQYQFTEVHSYASGEDG